MKKFTKTLALLLAGVWAVTSMTACQNESDGNTPPTPEEYMESVRSDADMIIHRVVRYGTEDGEKTFTYTYERDGDLLKNTTDGTVTMVRYYDFANEKVYFNSSGKWEAYGFSYDDDGWDEYLEDEMEIRFSMVSDEELVWKIDNYRKDGDRYVMTEEAVNAIVEQEENFHDSYGANPVLSISFEKKDGAYVFIEYLQGEDESIYMENVITVTLKDVTVELPEVDE
ncbi:MAG: hypothetical protein IJX47_05195 [Clostridia bacterium]|nr:hypothetical protein [Clostridia bacterium]